ncbi:MAG: glutamine amidotransferase [Polyangiaceae bacterium]|nr:glutamine amidotransferase [Polyangiaceae bacterium]
MKKIVIVRTGEPVPSMLERRGHFSDMIRGAVGDAWSGGYDEIDARTGDLRDPGDAAAFVITGSAANVPTREPWMLATEAWLREVAGRGTPTFGICFGHQILAQALGGEVVKNPRGREIGTVRIERRADDPIFDGLPATFDANVTHVDTVGKLPEGAVSLARSDREEHHAIRFTRTCYGVQFHPEIDREILAGYIEARIEILRAERFDVEALLEGLTEGAPGAQVLRNFIRRFVRGA